MVIITGKLFKLVLAHRLLARISFKLRKFDSKRYYRYIIFVSIT